MGMDKREWKEELYRGSVKQGDVVYSVSYLGPIFTVITARVNLNAAGKGLYPKQDGLVAEGAGRRNELDEYDIDRGLEAAYNRAKAAIFVKLNNVTLDPHEVLKG